LKEEVGFESLRSMEVEKQRRERFAVSLICIFDSIF